MVLFPMCAVVLLQQALFMPNCRSPNGMGNARSIEQQGTNTKLNWPRDGC
jgi:hypothetical protein